MSIKCRYFVNRREILLIDEHENVVLSLKSVNLEKRGSTYFIIINGKIEGCMDINIEFEEL